MAKVLPVILVSLLAFAVTVQAGLNPNAKAAVHVLAHNPALTCSHDFPEITSCQQIVTTYGGCDDVDVFPVFFDLVEYQGVEYGIEWPGIGSCAFTSCSDLTIGSIVNSGDGISHAWYVCHSGPVAIPGWGWLTADEYGSVCLVAHPLAGGIIVGDCYYDNALDTLDAAFCAGVCGMPGDEVCVAVFHPIDLSKTDGLPGQCVDPGDNIAYEIGYDNSPNFEDVHNVVLTDHLDPDTDYLSASAGGVYDPGAHTVTWSLGTLTPGETGSVDLAVEVALTASPGTPIENRCEIVCDEADPSEVTEYTGVCPDIYAPLGLAKGDRLHGDCVEPGATIKYWIPYDNDANPYAVHNVVMTDYLPEEGEYMSCTGGGVYDAGSHSVVWNRGTLAAGANSLIDLSVRIDGGTPAGTIISNVCEITGDETPVTQTTKETEVCAPGFHSPALTKTDGLGEGCPGPGDTVTYTIVYDNTPNVLDIHNVVLTDWLPAETGYVSGSGGCVYNDGLHTVTWDLGTVAAGVVDSLQLAVRVDSGIQSGQVLTNVCELSCDEVPPVQAEETTAACTFGFMPLGLGKADQFDGGCVPYWGEIHYKIGYSNPNSLEVHNVTLVDAVPPETDFISATGGGTYHPGTATVVWDLGTISAGLTDTTKMVVGVKPGIEMGTLIENTVTITGQETGPTVASTMSKVCHGVHNNYVRVAIHVEPHGSRTCSMNLPAISECEDIETTAAGNDVDAFVVFYDLAEYQGLDYGLTWPGTYTCAFTSCSDLSIGGISNPGDGISHAWYVCQYGPAVIAGWAWITEPGPAEICPAPHPTAGGPNVGDCSGQIVDLMPDFCAGIGGTSGENPCSYPTNVRPTTWGGIKAMFK